MAMSGGRTESTSKPSTGVQNDQYHRDHADETKGPHEVERSPGDDAGKFVAVRSKARNQPAERAVIEVRKLQFLQAVKTVPPDVVAHMAGKRHRRSQ